MKDPGRSRQVPGPRPLLRARPRALRHRRLRPVDGRGRRGSARPSSRTGRAWPSPTAPSSPSTRSQAPEAASSGRLVAELGVGAARLAPQRPARGHGRGGVVDAGHHVDHERRRPWAPPRDTVSVTEPCVAGVANAHAGPVAARRRDHDAQAGAGPEDVGDGIDRDPHQRVPARQARLRRSDSRYVGTGSSAVDDGSSVRLARAQETRGDVLLLGVPGSYLGHRHLQIGGRRRWTAATGRGWPGRRWWWSMANGAASRRPTRWRPAPSSSCRGAAPPTRWRGGQVGGGSDRGIGPERRRGRHRALDGVVSEPSGPR